MYEQHLLVEHISIPKEDHERVNWIIANSTLSFSESIRQILEQPLADNNPQIVELVERLEVVENERVSSLIVTKRTVQLNTEMGVVSILLTPLHEEVIYN